MHNLRFIILISLAVIIISCNNSSTKKENNMKTKTSKEIGDIFPRGEKINNDYFSGEAWLQMLITDKENFDTTIGNVIFEPGVRNNWHSHPGGQILLCTAGEGYYQEKGQPIRLLHKGDVVEILPNIIHWHGATPNSAFEHISISPQSHKGIVVWLEPVTDAEYNGYVE